MLKPTDWQDQWIAENYPHAVFSEEVQTGEIVVSLGVDGDGEEVS
jgi:hypothetical protein